MIEVVSLVAGKVRDRCEAESPESAVSAARCLLREATGDGCAASKCSVAFYVAGRFVRESRIVDLGGIS